MSLHVDPGEVVALVGESGAGKSATAMAVVGLLPEYAEVSGSVRLHGNELLGLSDNEMSRIRGATIGTVFQDPMSALTPVYTVGDQIAEALRVHDREIGRRAARQPRGRTARTGRHRPAGTPGAGVPPRAVRRRAPARGDRDRHRQRPRPVDLRRAHHRAGRDRSGADPRRAQDRPRRHRRRRADHHPRPRRGRRVRRPRAGDVRRPGGRNGVGDDAVPRPPDALHRRAAGLGAAAGRPAGRAAGADPRRTAVAGRAAARLPVRAALPAGHRRLPRRRTRADRGRPHAPGRLHPHRAGGRAQRRRHLRRLDRPPAGRAAPLPTHRWCCGCAIW